MPRKTPGAPMRRPRPWHRQLAKLNPCKPAVRWARQFDTYEEAWRACENDGWLLWLINQTYGSFSAEAARAQQSHGVGCAAARAALSLSPRSWRPSGRVARGVCAAIRSVVRRPPLPEIPL